MGNLQVNILWTDSLNHEFIDDIFSSLKNDFLCWLPHEVESFYENLKKRQAGIALLSDASIRSNQPFWLKVLKHKKWFSETCS